MASTYLRPGVFVGEVALPQQVAVQNNGQAFGAFVGSAVRGPETPVLVTSWGQFVRRFGGFKDALASNNRLATAVYLFFANGGGACWVQRIANSATVATVSLSDGSTNTLKIDAIDKGAWANSASNGLFVQVSNVRGTGASGATVNGDVFDLTVFYGGSDQSNIVEKWTSISLDPSNGRNLETINGSSQWIKCTALNATTSKKPPVATTASGAPSVATLTGGADGSALVAADYTAATSKFDSIQQNLVFNVPGAFDFAYADAAAIYAAYIDYAAGRGDSFVVFEPSSDKEATAADAIAFNAQVARDSAYAASYYPSIQIVNPSPNSSTALITVPVGGAVVGKYLYTDTVSGTFKAPAGIGATVVGAVSTTASLTAADLDALNSAAKPVNAIRPVPGAGFCIMGARTQSSNLKNRYVPARRTLLQVKKRTQDLLNFAVFEVNDYRLWGRARTILNGYLQEMYQAGAFKGATPAQAYYVKCDGSNNPANSVAEGTLNVEIGVALSTPAEFVVIRIGQFDGATSVTETL